MYEINWKQQTSGLDWASHSSSSACSFVGPTSALRAQAGWVWTLPPHRPRRCSLVRLCPSGAPAGTAITGSDRCFLPPHKQDVTIQLFCPSVYSEHFRACVCVLPVRFPGELRSSPDIRGVLGPRFCLSTFMAVGEVTWVGIICTAGETDETSQVYAGLQRTA